MSTLEILCWSLDEICIVGSILMILKEKQRNLDFYKINILTSISNIFFFGQQVFILVFMHFLNI